MWTLLSTIEQIQSLKVNGFILQHPSNDSEASTNPTGQEENSNIYSCLLYTSDAADE